MNNSDYWKQRFEQLENKRHSQSLELSGEIKNIFEKAQKSLENQIELWFRRLADNNGVSIAEARKMLSKKELKELKWDVNQYIRHGENNINGQWNRQLENASARFHISRLEALEIYIQQQLESLYGEYEIKLTDDLKSTYEDDYLHTAYELQKGSGIGTFIAKPDKNVVEKLLLKPWAEDGYNFSERIWRDKQKLISVAFAEITKNILTGQNPQKAIDAIAKKMNTSKYNAGRLVMTEEAYFSSLATGEAYKAHGYEQYQILATLDNRTSEICQQMDSKVFPTSEYQAGVTAPPFHVLCRSTTVPYFDKNYSVNAERSARDPETEKTYYVPADMTYSQWKQKFVGNKGYEKFKKEYWELTSSEKGGTIKKRPYEIIKSRKKRLEIVNRGISEDKPIFAVDNDTNKFASYVRNVKPKDDFYDVALHGAPTSAEFFGEEIDAYTLANIIRNRKDYTSGKKIRLLSCSTGNTDETGDCFAQLLANELGVEVEAPTKTLWVKADGSYTVGTFDFSEDGEMKLFYSRR